MGRASLAGNNLKALVAQLPFGRRGVPEAIADAVIVIASDAGACTVGSEFVIDGDMSNLGARV